jgi:RNA polymerase sigma-70 factor (ECF subfamily)
MRTKHGRGSPGAGHPGLGVGSRFAASSIAGPTRGGNSTETPAARETTTPVADAVERSPLVPGGGGESELVRRAVVALKQGDRSALHFLYLRYADDVRGFVRSIVRDAHEAEDITHDVFAKLVTAIHRYEPREVPFAAWILRVSRNAALDHLRARRQIPFEEVRTTDKGHEQVGFDRSQSLREAFHRLPPDQRQVLVLRHIAGLAPSEIADRLGKTESSVHGLHHRGRGALKAALRELEAAPVIAGQEACAQIRAGRDRAGDPRGQRRRQG